MSELHLVSIFTNDKKTVEYDWKEHLQRCPSCAGYELALANKVIPTLEQRNERNQHYERVHQLAERYPVNCARCDAALEDSTFKCYAIVDGVRCGSTKLYYRAHQKKPALT